MSPARARFAQRAGLALGAVAAMAGAALARPVVVHGVVRRADNGDPIQGATVAIKPDGLVGTPARETVVTDQKGAFRVAASLDNYDLTCEASVDGMFVQRVNTSVRAPTCNFELESKLVLKDITPQSPVVGRGPGLSFLAHSDMDLLLSKLTVRLHLAKPLSCGSPGEVQQYALDGTVEVNFGAVRGTIRTGAAAFEMTGRAPLRVCEESEVSLIVLPARRLGTGDTQIVITLPSKLTLQRKTAQRTIQLNADSGFSAAYRSTIDRVTIELVTSRNSLASAELPGLAIPVGVAQEAPAPHGRRSRPSEQSRETK